MNSAIGLKLFNDNRNIIEKEIKIRTNDLISSGRFFYSDYDDIYSDLEKTVRRSLAKYDQSRSGILTYIKCVLKKRGVDLLRRKKARLRKSGIMESTEELLENIELGKSQRFSEFFISPDTSYMLKFEVEFALSELSDELREIGRLYLLESYTAVEISKFLKKSRTTVNKRIKEIRKIFIS
jgi:hypothetical protein